MESRRAEAFSDGVLAIAITLLVLDLRLPPANGHTLTFLLLHDWPQYFAYVVSFLTIGIMWMNHHTIFAHITRVDRPLLVINLLLLMCVVAIPFPTSLVAEHLRASGGVAATVTYGLVLNRFYGVAPERTGGLIEVHLPQRRRVDARTSEGRERDRPRSRGAH